MIKNLVLVGLGSSIGGMLRYVISLCIRHNNFPIHTFLVNIFGSFCIGLIFAYVAKQEPHAETIKLFFATGICGGFTTFSAFSMESVQYIKLQQYGMAMLYIILSIMSCLSAVFIGVKVANQV